MEGDFRLFYVWMRDKWLHVEAVSIPCLFFWKLVLSVLGKWQATAWKPFLLFYLLTQLSMLNIGITLLTNG